MMQDGNNLKLLTIGGSGKIGKFCIQKWLEKGEIERVWNFDINKLDKKKVIDIQHNILEKKGYECLSRILIEEKPSKIIIFAGYDFPRSKEAKSYFSPYAIKMNESIKSWEINCMLPLLVLQCIHENKYKGITLTLIGSIYGERLPKVNLYSDEENIYKPVVYGMCKSALEYLNKQASITLAKIEGKSNIVRFGGIDIGIDEKFKKRYEHLSPTKKMVSLNSVYKTLTFIGIKNISDMNGAVIDVDSGMRHS